MRQEIREYESCFAMVLIVDNEILKTTKWYNTKENAKNAKWSYRFIGNNLIEI